MALVACSRPSATAEAQSDGAATTAPSAPVAVAAPALDADASAVVAESASPSTDAVPDSGTKAIARASASSRPSAAKESSGRGEGIFIQLPDSIKVTEKGIAVDHASKSEVRRIIRDNHERFRLCYGNALRSNPDLAGAITVTFDIDRDGDVRHVVDSNVTIPDWGVVRCVVRGFENLSFPQPDEVSHVTYSMAFSNTKK